jgi:RNA polymerase sigma factor (sigma-70 family)
VSLTVPPLSSQEFLPAFTAEELMEVARAAAGRLDPAIQEDAAQEFVLGALIAQQRARKGKAIRTYQWCRGLGRMKNFLREVRRRRITETVRLDGVNSDEDGGGGMHDTIGDRRISPPSDLCADEDFRKRIAAVVDGLPARQRFVLRERFWKNRSTDDIGAELGMSGQRVRQILNETLPTLRRVLESEEARGANAR